MKYLIKLGSEITIKSDAVRRNCIKLLKKNILSHFDYYEIDIKLEGNWDRIVGEVSDLEDQKRVIKIISSISGIEHFSSIVDYELSGEIMRDNVKIFKQVSEICIKHFREQIEGKSFAVRIHRVGEHSFKSTDLERHVGSELFLGAKQTSVSLNNPDITVKLDIRDNAVFVLAKRIQGISGYPVGFQGKLISLISGGFDSSVSTHSLIKRGCCVDYLFFNLGGDAHELGVKQMSHFLWSNFSLPYKKAKFISIPFELVVKDIVKNIPSRFRAIVLKRCMLKAASEFSDYYCGAIKGDSVGQVSSQTLQNLRVIDTAADILILRPLVGMNKIDIMNMAKTIGTHDAAAAMPEYCGVVSQRPETKAKLEDVLEAEKSLGKNIIITAVNNKKIERVVDMLFKEQQIGNMQEVKQVEKGEFIIDIREPDRIKKSPLSQKGFTVNHEIPFYDINHKFPKLNQDKQYLFYCDKGVLSHLHGLYLQEKGFTNIKVLRPSS